MPIPYNPEPSSTRFYVPKTLVSDFDNFLDNDIPGAVMGFTHLHNWYDQFKEDYEPKVIRGEIYPDATKSRYANTDNNLNFRASYNSDIEAGDIIIDPNSIIYLLDWEVPPQPNNKMSRALRCNTLFTFERYVHEETDDDGYLIQPEGFKTIAEKIPCNTYRYDGRPEYSAQSYTPGVVPNALTLLSVQLNEQTAEIQVDDEFTWVRDRYVVIDVSYAGTDIYSNRGVLKLQVKKKAGGSEHPE